MSCVCETNKPKAYFHQSLERSYMIDVHRWHYFRDYATFVCFPPRNELLQMSARLEKDIINFAFLVKGIWDEVFKSGLSTFCGRQPLKIYLVHS